MSELITLMLAWKMAEKYDEDVCRTVRKCAAKLRKETADPKMKEFFQLFTHPKTTDAKVLGLLKSTHTNMKLEGLI